MCGLVWVSGNQSGEWARSALGRLEYRGYDSFGFACLTSAGLESRRSLDGLATFSEPLPASDMVLGHTRWATHGSVSLANCHPHFDPKARFALAHNGIAENANQLYVQQHLNLDAEVLDTSATSDVSDTRLLCAVLSQKLDQGVPPQDAFFSLVTTLEGRNTMVCMFADGVVMAYRLGSPLIVLELVKGGFAFASDIMALGEHAVGCYPLEDREVVVYKNNQVSILRQSIQSEVTKVSQVISEQKDSAFSGGVVSQISRSKDVLSNHLQSSDVAPNTVRPNNTQAITAVPMVERFEVVTPTWQELDSDDCDAFNEVDDTSVPPGYYMRQEILEQWRTIPIQGQRNAAELLDSLNGATHIIVMGAGGAGIVADQIARIIAQQTQYRVTAVSACEFGRMENFAPNACVLAISQSGETADTLCAMAQARDWGMSVISLVNMPFSSMSRGSDYSFHLGAGAEQCVLSTKSATAQISFGFWMAGVLARTEQQTQNALQLLGRKLSEELASSEFDAFGPAVNYLQHRSSVFLLGRGVHHASACLGALNLKEASYIHAEAFSAGELKHGVIALIEQGTPVILFGLDEDLYMQNVAAELRSRGAWILSVGSEKGDIEIPSFGDGHILSTPITCQILAMLLALTKGINPDRPRNLAKSVTVL